MGRPPPAHAGRLRSDHAAAARSHGRENVRYAEINLSAGVILWRKQDLAAIFEAVNDEAAEAPGRGALDLGRRAAVGRRGGHAGGRTGRRADRRAASSASGLGGDEARGPVEKFAERLRLRAAQRAAPGAARAARSPGPESVWAAVELGAERIGHGIAAADDHALLRHLREHDIPLEICITRNVATGAVGSPGRSSRAPHLRRRRAHRAQHRRPRHVPHHAHARVRDRARCLRLQPDGAAQLPPTVSATPSPTRADRLREDISAAA